MLALPPGFKEAFFPASEVPIHYLEGPANGPTLLLLHGTGRDWNSFSSLLPQLAPRFHLFLVDLRGHGASGRAPGRYRVTHFADDIQQLVEQIVPPKPAIFGHSLGGVVALTVATRCALSAVIVGDSMLSAENFRASIYHHLFREIRRLLLTGGSQQEIATGIGEIELRLPGIDELIPIKDLPGNSPATLREWARSAMCTDPDVLGMSVTGESYEDWNAAQVLPLVSCPVLLIQANPELDGLLCDEDVRLAERLLHRVEHVKFPLLGHALFMQRPEPILQAITDFLARPAFVPGK